MGNSFSDEIVKNNPPDRVLLTGVTGFIGRHLAAHLITNGIQVYAIVRPGSDAQNIPEQVISLIHDGTVQGLIDCLEIATPDVVIHLASCFLASHKPEDIDRLVDSNIRFGLQLLEAMKVTGCKKMINTGTAWQHFENRGYDPVCLYAATKQAFDDLIAYYTNAHAFQVITLKLHDTYGPDDPRRKIISLLMEAAEAQTQLDLSPGEQLIDLTHVDDVISAYMAGINAIMRQQKAGCETYMISSGNPLSLKQIASLIEKALNKPIKARWGARTYRDREVMIPWNGGKLPPGWNPEIQLSDWIKGS